MSTISASTTSTTAYKVTADTTGALVLQTGATPTTALTLSSGQAATFAGTVTNPTTISVGGATPSASGAGVTFPAAQSTSSDANTLDDYEEGTFTPTIVGSTSAGTGTYSVQVGAYTKIGNMVAYRIFLVWSAHTGTGNMSISGLPFSSPTSGWSPCATRVVSVSMTASNYLQALVATASSTINLEQVPTGGGSESSVPMDTSAQIMLSGIYMV